MSDVYTYTYKISFLHPIILRIPIHVLKEVIYKADIVLNTSASSQTTIDGVVVALCH